MDDRRPDPSGWRAVADPDVIALRAKALSSPIRWRILRLCLHTPRTNKELAETLQTNPGSMLHHVRTLVSAGFLAPQEVRRGARNSVEIPYVATELTWETANGVPEAHGVMMELLRREGNDLPDDDGGKLWRLGVRLRPGEVEELRERLSELFAEFRGRSNGAPDGVPVSLVAFLHPDVLQGLGDPS